MIELILQAERALAVGMLDQAERLYQQAAELDPRNSIAVVGLARVALDRADDRRALELARQALTIDPENAAAQRLAERLDEVLRFRGEPLPEPAAPHTPEPGPVTEPSAAGEPELPAVAAVPEPEPEPQPEQPAAAAVPEPQPQPQPAAMPELEPVPESVAAPAPAPAPAPRRRSLIDRLLRRR